MFGDLGEAAQKNNLFCTHFSLYHFIFAEYLNLSRILKITALDIFRALSLSLNLILYFSCFDKIFTLRYFIPPVVLPFNAWVFPLQPASRVAETPRTRVIHTLVKPEILVRGVGVQIAALEAAKLPVRIANVDPAITF